METTVRAVYTNGVFTPTKRYKLKLKKGEGVELLIKKLAEAERDPAYNFSDLAVETGIPDLASEHDHFNCSDARKRIKRGFGT